MRFLVAVKSCQKDRQNGVHQAIRETWGKELPKGVDLLFFIGGEQPPLGLEEDERHLSVPDGYWDLPLKTIAIAKYAAWKNYDFLYPCDTDTYLNLSKLMHSGFDSYDYCGVVGADPSRAFGVVYPGVKTEHGLHMLHWYKYLSGGHGYCLSKTAIKIVAASSCSGHELEDMMIGIILGPFIITKEIKAGLLSAREEIAVHLNCGYYGSNRKISVGNRSDVATALWKKHKELTGQSRPVNPALKESGRSKTALVIIAMGEIYWRYAESLIASAKRFFIPHDVFLFTDSEAMFDVKKQIFVPSFGFTAATLLRYHWVLTEEKALAQYDNIFYCDADMLFVAPITEGEILSCGITATEHPGYLDLPGTPETRQDSGAYVKCVRTYFCGGFNGGSSDAYLKMARIIREAVNLDLDHRIVALWFDESYLNRYCYDNPPTKVLTVAFCYPYPEWATIRCKDLWAKTRGADYPNTIVPKLLAIEKSAEERISRGGPG